MEDAHHFKTTAGARAAIKRSKVVYIAVMCGNASTHVRVTKLEAKEWLRQLDRSWGDTWGDLGVSSLGYRRGEETVLGGC